MRGTEHPAEAVLRKFAGGELSAQARSQVIYHLAECDSCKHAYDSLGLQTLPLAEGNPGETMLMEDGDELVGSTLGEYRVIERIAQGAMGVLYRGDHPVIGRKVAIKVLLSEIAATDAGAMARMVDEARVANAVRHPNIIDVFAFGQLPDGRPYMVMEFLEGMSLAELQNNQGRLKTFQALSLMEQALAALEAAHAAGVIHRDIKPENLFLRPDGNTWKLTVVDFGLALQSLSNNPRLTEPGRVVGTPLFMSPEQVSNRELTVSTDIYSLGCVAWSMLTGRVLFEGGSVVEIMHRHLKESPARVRTLAPDVPEGVEALVKEMLSKDPADRPTAAVARARVNEMLETFTAPRRGDLSKKTQRTGYFVLAGAGALLGAALYVGFSEQSAAPTQVPLANTPPPPGPVVKPEPPVKSVVPDPPAAPTPPPVEVAEPATPGAGLPPGVRRWRCADIEEISDKVWQSASDSSFVFEVNFKGQRLLVSRTLPPDVRARGLAALEALRKTVVACKGTQKELFTRETRGHGFLDTRDGPKFIPGLLAESEDVLWQSPEVAAAPEKGAGKDEPVVAGKGRHWKCADIKAVTLVLESKERPSYVFGVTFKSDLTLLVSRATTAESRIRDFTELSVLRDTVEACRGGSKVLVAASTRPHDTWGTRGGPMFGHGEPLAEWQDVSVQRAAAPKKKP